jgi:hypothetical protein
MNISGVPAEKDDGLGSPMASGPSDSASAMSSSDEASPSPRLDGVVGGGRGGRKRFSSHSSAYSRSYESSVFSDNANGRGNSYAGHNRQWSSDQNGRPTTSGTSVAGSVTDEEYSDKPSAGLSRSYGHAGNGTGPWQYGQANGSQNHYTPADAPPVPVIDQLWKSPKETQLSGSGSTIRGGVVPESFVRAGAPTVSREANVNPDLANDDVEMADDDDVVQGSTATNGLAEHNQRYYHEVEDGMFGKMDE